jgi:hypothetical protein
MTQLDGAKRRLARGSDGQGGHGDALRCASRVNVAEARVVGELRQLFGAGVAHEVVRVLERYDSQQRQVADRGVVLHFEA